MASPKQVSKSNFVLGHVLTIVFHALIALAVLYTQYKEKAFWMDNRKVIIGLMVILLLVSLLGLIPVLQSQEYVIS